MAFAWLGKHLCARNMQPAPDRSRGILLVVREMVCHRSVLFTFVNTIYVQMKMVMERR